MKARRRPSKNEVLVAEADLAATGLILDASSAILARLLASCTRVNEQLARPWF